jgi:hypothetical protein
MVTRGVSAVLMMLMGCIGLIFRKISEGARGTFLDILVLR